MIWRINLDFLGRKFPQFSCDETAQTKEHAIAQAKRYAAACGFTATVKKVTAVPIREAA